MTDYSLLYGHSDTSSCCFLYSVTVTEVSDLVTSDLRSLCRLRQSWDRSPVVEPAKPAAKQKDDWYSSAGKSSSWFSLVSGNIHSDKMAAVALYYQRQFGDFSSDTWARLTKLSAVYRKERKRDYFLNKSTTQSLYKTYSLVTLTRIRLWCVRLLSYYFNRDFKYFRFWINPKYKPFVFGFSNFNIITTE